MIENNDSNLKNDDVSPYGNISNMLNLVGNRVSGLGQNGYDSLNSLEISDKFLYQNSRFLYDSFYHNIWLVRNVVDLRPYQMGSAWGKFSSNDIDINEVGKINKFLSSLKRKYQHGQMLANKDGGSTIVRLVDDKNTDFSQPINTNKINSIRYSRVFDRWEIFPDPTSYYENPYDPEYYLTAINPEDKSLGYQNVITLPKNEYRGGSTYFYRIHKSRILRFRGLFVNAYSLQRNQGWESSILPCFLYPLMRYLQALGHVGESVTSFELTVFLIENLIASMGDKEGRDNLRTRFAVNNSTMSSMRGLVADKSREDVKIISRNYGGVAAILDELRKEMQGASGLNAVELFQEHPTGMQATGQSERLDQAYKIMQLCDYEWSDNMIGIDSDGVYGDIDYYLLSKECSVNPDIEWEWNWNSAINLTPMEEAELREKYVSIDAQNINSGVYSNMSARTRYENNKFNREINLLENDVNLIKISQLNKEKKKQEDELKNDAVEKFIPSSSKLLTDSDYESIIKELFSS